MLITQAKPSDADTITALTLRSKDHWNYGKAQIEAWYEDLEVSETFIRSNSVFKMVVKDQITGFYAFSEKNKHAILEFLFIAPEYIGKGIGKTLMEHFLQKMQVLHIKSVTLDADPHAVGFYQKFGFVTVNEKPSSIPGRYLPVMQLQLNSK